MTDITAAPLLAPFEGRMPDRPAWFTDSLRQAPERRFHDVQGASIEALSWGDVGKPGLLLLHGKMAHADWWSFIAPFFAATHRVTAFSWSGMGGSGWRENYSVDTMAEEAMAIARAEGLFEGRVKPVFVAHSFGAFAALRCVELHGAQLGGLLTVDMPLLSRAMREARQTSIRGRIAQRPTRIYPTLQAALARFRLAPEQPCENLFIADHIARTSLKQVPMDGHDEAGWTWRFDPRVANILPGEAARSLRAAQCPVAFSWGGESALVVPEVVAYIASIATADAPQIEIPAARHHVMVDQPLAFVSALRALLEVWPRPAGTAP
jgi:pimeloyl-ACP methyl ester carboxylesterase